MTESEWKHLRDLKYEEEVDIQLNDGSIIRNVIPQHGQSDFYWKKLNVYFDDYLVDYWRKNV